MAALDPVKELAASAAPMLSYGKTNEAREKTMAITIRRIQPDDVEAIHQILLSPHVIQGSMRLPYESLEHTRKRLAPVDGVIALAALAEDQVIGFAELITHPEVPRHRHAGEVNMIAVHADWQGAGVGRKLMTALIDLADNWLQLRRLGLSVWVDNAAGLHLYESLGFQREGTLRDYVYRDGAFVDAHVMGRLRDHA